MLLAKRGRSERESKANEVERKGVLCSSRFFFHLRAAMKTHARPVPSPSARPSKARPSFSLSAIGGSHARRHWSRTVARSGFDASFCRLFPFLSFCFFRSLLPPPRVHCLYLFCRAAAFARGESTLVPAQPYKPGRPRASPVVPPLFASLSCSSASIGRGERINTSETALNSTWPTLFCSPDYTMRHGDTLSGAFYLFFCSFVMWRTLSVPQ